MMDSLGFKSTNVLDSLADAFQNTWDGMKQGVKDILKDLQPMWDEFKEAFHDIGESLRSTHDPLDKTNDKASGLYLVFRAIGRVVGLLATGFAFFALALTWGVEGVARLQKLLGGQLISDLLVPKLGVSVQDMGTLLSKSEKVMKVWEAVKYLATKAAAEKRAQQRAYYGPVFRADSPIAVPDQQTDEERRLLDRPGSLEPPPPGYSRPPPAHASVEAIRAAATAMSAFSGVQPPDERVEEFNYQKLAEAMSQLNVQLNIDGTKFDALMRRSRIVRGLPG